MRRSAGLFAVLLIVTSCSVVSGSGVIVTEVRDLAGFASVHVGDGLDLELTVGEGASISVVVRYDDNLIDDVVTRLDGDRLVVEFEGNVSFGAGDTAVEVVMPRIENLIASGGANVVASGTVANYTIDASGGAAVDAMELIAEVVDIDASGGASVSAFATSAATGNASGGSTVLVGGEPPSFAIDASGGATVSEG